MRLVERRLVSVDDLCDPDVHVRGEAWSQLERETRRGPGSFERYRENLLQALDSEEPWAIRLQIVRLVSRLSWSGVEYQSVLKFLFTEARRENLFIRAWALDSLSILAVRDARIRNEVETLLRKGLESSSAAVKVRARRGMERLCA